MSVFEAIKPQIGQPHTAYAQPAPSPFQQQVPFQHLQQSPYQQFPQFPQFPQQFPQAMPFQQFPQAFQQPMPYQQFPQQYPQPMPYQQFPQQYPQPMPFQQFQQFQQPMPYLPFQQQNPLQPHLSPVVADAAARLAPVVINVVTEALRNEPQALSGIQTTGQIPPHVYAVALMEAANRIAPVLHAVLVQQTQQYGQFPQFPQFPQYGQFPQFPQYGQFPQYAQPMPFGQQQFAPQMPFFAR